ncbi:MAG: hypothetical protein IKR74_03575 [Bacilli bacterium]|nr:hypothetical protein [Bacilli bacterium]
MEKIIEFATHYYLIFTIVTAFLILALIGYNVENRAGRDIKIKKKKTKGKIEASTETPVINQPNNTIQ